MTEIKFAGLLRKLLFLFYLSPLIYFLTKFRPDSNFNLQEVLWALRNSVLQSTVAASLVLAAAFLMSRGLFNLNGRGRWVLHRALLLPQILPVLFSVLIVFAMVNPFPKGNVGIILLFWVVNVGLAAVLLHEAIKEKSGKLAVIAEVYDLSKFVFLRRVLLPLLLPDLLRVFFLVFVFCLSSFSIPIIAGDGRGINLEILVFEKIFIDLNWASAFNVSLIQTLIVFSFGYLLVNEKSAKPESFVEGRYLQSRLGLLLAGGFSLLYVGGYIYGMSRSLASIDTILQFKAELFSAFVFSMKTLSVYAVFSCLMLVLWVYDYIRNLEFNPALNLISLSTVVVGFSFYLFFPTSPDVDYAKLILALSILMFPTLFKLFLQSPLQALKRQIEVARIFGLTDTRIIFDVVLPQTFAPLRLWLAVLCLWFASDYAVSRSVGLQTTTLGTLSESFLNSYRLNASYWMSSVILFSVFLFLTVFIFLMKVIYVGYKKSSL